MASADIPRLEMLQVADMVAREKSIEREEVLEAMEDIAAQGTHILTLGQYMQPTLEHLPIERYVHPDEFAELKRLGEQMGLKHVEAGPLVRSSYHAFEQEEAARS